MEIEILISLQVAEATKENSVIDNVKGMHICSQYLKICLLLRMAGHGSSAKAPDKLSNSNNFLQKVEDIKSCRRHQMQLKP